MFVNTKHRYKAIETPNNRKQDQRHKYHHLTKTLHLTATQVVETSVTNNILSEDHSRPDDHKRQITKTQNSYGRISAYLGDRLLYLGTIDNRFRSVFFKKSVLGVDSTISSFGRHLDFDEIPLLTAQENK